MWKEFLTSPTAWGLIATLVVLEGLLSADNALVLAIMVKKLPEKYQKKALFYGLFGAYFFRFIAIGIGIFLVKFWWIKLIGAGYLYMLSIKFFKELWSKKKGDDDEDEENMDNSIFGKVRQALMKKIGVFWATVASIELMDLAFSVDSILAALAISNSVPVLLLGGMLGILMMRGVAGILLKLLEKVPELEVTAHILIFLIATKMFISIFHIEISHALFFTVIVVTFALTFLVHFIRKKKQAN